ncbi:MAG TPA: VOC family protein [Mycobacteriales bacterium]|nr:VOC family protein [Mycobacteriales bacterium]
MDHIGLCPADFDASLRFYVDGIGLEVVFDVTLPMDMEAFLGVKTEKARTLFLAQPGNPGATRLELLDLYDGRARAEPAGDGLPHRGLTLISFHVPVDETLARLAALGLGGTPRRIRAREGFAATVTDPDGVMVELVDARVSF